MISRLININSRLRRTITNRVQKEWLQQSNHVLKGYYSFSSSAPGSRLPKWYAVLLAITSRQLQPIISSEYLTNNFWSNYLCSKWCRDDSPPSIQTKSKPSKKLMSMPKHLKKAIYALVLQCVAKHHHHEYEQDHNCTSINTRAPANGAPTIMKIPATAKQSD